MGDIALHSDVKDALKKVQANESSQNIIDFIVKIIEKNEKWCSELVLEYGIKLLNDSTELQDSSNSRILEEVFLAALECKEIEWANLLLLLINQQSPHSPDTVRFMAMIREVSGNQFNETKSVYRELLKANPEDTQSYRRLAAFLKDENLKDEAIETINCGLKMDMTDAQGWLQLAELFITHMNYQKAAYCFEEVLIQKPNNFLYNTKYAELLYSMGGGDNLVLARKYFSKSVSLTSNVDFKPDGSLFTNVRAIWGLLETCTRLEDLSNRYKDEINEDLIEMW
jgi:ER membrane protein complex subunit 2